MVAMYIRVVIVGLLWVALVFVAWDALVPALEGQPPAQNLEGLVAGIFFALPAMTLAALLTKFRKWPSLLAALWLLFVIAVHVQFTTEPGAAAIWTLFFGFTVLTFVAAMLSFVQHLRGAAHLGHPILSRLLLWGVCIFAATLLLFLFFDAST